MRNNFRENISNEELAELPAGGFPGRIVVVDHVKDVAAACADLLSRPAIGFDTETRPSFKAGATNKVALLQLSTPDTCYLFRLCRLPLEREILNVLESKTTLKIGAAIHDDIRTLQSLRHFRQGGFVDLQSIVGEWGVAEKSVRKMAGIVLGMRISKAQRLSNWEAAGLTPAQQLYAATDAWTCLKMYEILASTEKNPLPPAPKNGDRQKEDGAAPKTGKPATRPAGRANEGNVKHRTKPVPEVKLEVTHEARPEVAPKVKHEVKPRSGHEAGAGGAEKKGRRSFAGRRFFKIKRKPE